jgi:uncharacterized protein (TIGR03545 family)
MKIFRWAGIVPLLLITALIYVGSVYFLDAYLRHLLIQHGSKINDALVDVDSLNLSLMKSRLTIRGLRTADPKQLMTNRFDITTITADFKFLPLLKKKLIIDEVKVAEVRWGTTRRSSGEIPARWRAQWAAEEIAARNSLTSKAFAVLQKQVVAQLPKLDLDKLGEKFDPREWVKLEELTSYQQAKAIPDEIQRFATEWKGKGENFIATKGQEFENYKQKVESLDPRKFNHPADIVNGIQTVQGLQKELKKQQGSVNQTFLEAKAAADSQVEKIIQLRSALSNDIAMVKNRVALKDLDVNKIAQSIFGPAMIKSYTKYLPYYDRVRTGLSSFKKDASERVIRAKGRNIRFPITDATPSFLLAKLELSSDTRQNSDVPPTYRGFYQFRASSITSEPALVGKPMEFLLSAEMREANFKSAHLKLNIDRTKTEPHDWLELGLQAIKIGGTTLGEKSLMPVPVKTGAANLKVTLDIKHENLVADIRADLSGLTYGFAADPHQELLAEIIQEVISSLHQFDVQATLRGSLSEPQLAIRSSFDEALAHGVKKVLMAKLEKAKAQVEAYLHQEIDTKISQADQLLKSKSAEVLNPLNQQLQSVLNLDKILDGKLKELQKQQAQLLNDQLKKNLPSLPSRLPF